ncbi:MAG: CHAT domain-containing protein [Tannerella sp.]|jgi:CHAT domain-containing protein/Flp pilus assembly protein TadD|nr:CHAT domain-containing protein [Tannerella sp.]
MRQTLIGLFSLCILLFHTTGLSAQTGTAVSVLNQKGKTAYKQANYIQAEAFFTQALEKQPDGVRAGRSDDYPATLHGLGWVYFKKGRYAEADSLLREALRLRQERSGTESIEYAESLHSLATLLHGMQQYENVEEMLQKAIALRKKKLGAAHPDYAESLNSLGMFYTYTGAYKKAEPLLRKAAGIYAAACGEMSLEYANALFITGTYRLYTNDYAGAEEAYSTYINITRTLLGKNHPDYAEALLCMSTLKSYMGKYEASKALLLQARPIIETLEKTHPACVIWLLNMGGIYYQLSDYEKAEPLLREARVVSRRVFGEKHQYYFNTLNMLALLYQKTGHNEQAETMMLQSLKLRKEVYGELHQSVSMIIGNLAILYFGMGNYDRAETLTQDALAIAKATIGEATVEYGTKLLYLSLIYQKRGDLSQAFTAAEKAASILKKAAGEEHPLYLSALTTMASAVQWDAEVEQEVENIYLEVLKIQKKVLGESHRNYLITLNNLASFYENKGEGEKATLLYLQVLNGFGKNTPEYAKFLGNLGLNRLKQQDYIAAKPLFFEAFDVIKKEVQRNFLFLSEQERALFWDTWSYYLQFFQAFARQYQDQNPELPGFAYDCELFSRSLLLNSSLHMQQSILDTKDNKQIALWNTLNELKAAMIRLEDGIMKIYGLSSSAQLHEYLSNSDNAELKDMAKYISDQKDYINQQEKTFYAASAAYRTQQKALTIRWKDIQNELDSGEIAIEFIHPYTLDFEHPELTDTFYCALLIRPGAPRPEMLTLCTESELRTALQQSMSPHPSDALYTTLWQPLASRLRDCKHIYLAPTGLLHNLSFAAIRKGDRYVSDDHTIHYLLSTKDLIALKHKDPHRRIPTHAALFGGADFRMPMHELAKAAPAQNASASTNLTRSMIEQMDASRGQGFDYLPGSKKEVQQIAALLDGLRWRTDIYTDAHATETHFKSIAATQSAPSPGLIHLSTHGFYFPQPPVRELAPEPLLSVDSEQNAYRLSGHALMRSGLVFSGANRAWTGGASDDDTDDGILTAYEVSQMNLPNTELAVLSACETGRGDIHTGEGIYGLQRAFRLAGVRNLIVSLRKVPDKETVELMTAFYTQWAKGVPIHEAFTHAQRQMRHTYPDAPEKWAGFVMIE